MNNAVMNIHVQVSAWINVFTLLDEIIGSSASFVLKFLRNCYIVFQSGCIVLYYTSNVWEFQFLHIIKSTCYCLLLIIPMNVGVKWYLVVVLMWISLVTNDVKQLFISFLTIHIILCEKCLFNLFSSLIICVLLLNCKNFFNIF